MQQMRALPHFFAKFGAISPSPPKQVEEAKNPITVYKNYTIPPTVRKILMRQPFAVSKV